MTYNGAMATRPFFSTFAVRTRTIPARPALNAGQFVRVLAWLSLPVTLCLAITRQSLWIDEGFTFWFASRGGFQSFLKTVIGARSAPGDPQFILYLLHVW